MPASRIDFSSDLPSFVIESPQARFSVSPLAARLSRNGFEFRSPKAFPLWTEMTVEVEVPGRTGQLRCTGVVVACDGNRHIGYSVSLLFLSLPKGFEERLGLASEARS